MAILVDFSPVIMGNLFSHMDHVSEDGKIQPKLIRHMIFNSLRAINVQHSKTYGEMIICYDGFSNWRKEDFAYYKAHRAAANEAKTHIDWDVFWKCVNDSKKEVKENLPYLTLEIPRAEADDIIGTLAKYIFDTKPKEKVLVYSSDGDFKQLQRYPNVSQFTPLFSKMVKSVNPMEELKIKIIKGDKGDGVPNIKSDDDTIITEGKRAKVISQKFLDSLLNVPENEMHTKLSAIEHEKYLRNQRLIDLSYTPMEVKKEIISAYNKREIKGSMNALMSFLAQNKMEELSKRVGDFQVRSLKA